MSIGSFRGHICIHGLDIFTTSIYNFGDLPFVGQREDCVYQELVEGVG